MIDFVTCAEKFSIWTWHDDPNHVRREVFKSTPYFCGEIIPSNCSVLFASSVTGYLMRFQKDTRGFWRKARFMFDYGISEYTLLYIFEKFIVSTTAALTSYHIMTSLGLGIAGAAFYLGYSRHLSHPAFNATLASL